MTAPRPIDQQLAKLCQLTHRRAALLRDLRRIDAELNRIRREHGLKKL
jgi:hypothetical protein